MLFVQLSGAAPERYYAHTSLHAAYPNIGSGSGQIPSANVIPGQISANGKTKTRLPRSVRDDGNNFAIWLLLSIDS